MEGRSHVTSGIVIGLLAAPLLRVPDSELGRFTVTVAGFALTPDLDCPGATASRMLGPVTGALSDGAATSSAFVYGLSKGPNDDNSTGTHRHLTHTVLFSLALGALANATSFLSPWVVLAWFAFGVLGAQAAQVIPRWLSSAIAAGVPVEFRSQIRFVLRCWPTAIAAGTLLPLMNHHDVAAALAPMQGWMGHAVMLGCVTHLLGDAITRTGVPLLFPLMIKGQRWYEVKLLGRFALYTGKRVEKCLVFPALFVAAVLLVPGVWPHLSELLGQVGEQVAAAG